ncbi:MAG: cardiolipin synthase [Enterococcus sp.]
MEGILLGVDFLETLVLLIIFVNTIGAIITVFRRPRSIASVLSWLIALIFLPVVGFILYIFCGRGIDGETLYRFKSEEQKRIKEINQQIHENNKNYHRTVKTSGSELLERYLKNVEESPLSKGNSLNFYFDGNEKFDHLFADINQAKDHVHVEYYAFFNDKIGNRFLKVLIEKAKEGVEVCVIYDPWGGKGSNAKFFQPLVEVGGRVTPFITAKDLIRKTRINYHLHRKVVVIDGQIGWTGGFNVGDQYLETTKEFGYWRDTHGRIEGSAVFTLQEIFLKDWNASVTDARNELAYEERYFVLPTEAPGNVSMQIVSDGPESEEEILKSGFVKMILAAEEKLWIQSPYLIPDDTMLNALLIAARSGVDVRIMIPSIPDHAFIYRATQYYANYLHKMGVKIYHYDKGFIHAKTVIMDDLITSFGSTNQDIRSYALNFEVSAFVYDEAVALQMQEKFRADMLDCFELTDEIINNQSRWLLFKQNFSRLLSPIL